MLTLTQPKEIVLRDYQAAAIEGLRQGIRAGKRRQILVAGTGAGKTVCAAHLLREADRKGSYALFLVDRVSLVDQSSETFDSYGIRHGVLQGIHQRYAPRENVQVCSIQTLARRTLPRAPSLIVYDECFPGDVEVLTSQGFIRFDELHGEERFAQYDMASEAISFTQATRMVRRPAAGDVRRIKSDRRIDLTLTAGHELVVETKTLGRHKVQVANFRAGDKRMPVAGFAAGPDAVLTPTERFMIAYQADGSLHHQRADGGAVAAFSFSKQRKIDAFLEIVDRAGFRFTEVAPQSNGALNAKPRRRFMVSLPFVPTKRVWECLDLSALSAAKAAAVITEANRWDGHVQKQRATLWQLTTTCRATADFYQAICALAGMRATLRHSVDDRSAAFSDCYRLNIVTDTRHIGCQKLKAEPVEYEGDVFCVTVPTGCIVVRHNGKTIIVGNCHAQYRSTLDYIAANPQAVVVGLTATPFTAGMAEHWDGVVNVIPTRKLIEGGHLTEPVIYVARAPQDAELGLNSYGEFSDASASAAGVQIIGDVVAEWVAKTHEHFGGPRKTIVFSPTVDHGRELCAAFNAAGFNFQQISYLDKDDASRAAKITEFRQPDSLIHGLVSCGVLTKGFDVPDVAVGISCKPYRKSLSSHMQEIGRVMRPHPSTPKKIWLCHSGNIERFALDMFDVWENGAGELSSASKQDSKPRERGEAERKAVVCPECSGALRGPTCMACGWERPARSGIHAVEGDLHEFKLPDAMQPRAGLRAACLGDPKGVYAAALVYSLANTREEDRARKRAYAIWRGIYPSAKPGWGWFDMTPGAVSSDALALVERETKRFRKNARRAA